MTLRLHLRSEPRPPLALVPTVVIRSKGDADRRRHSDEGALPLPRFDQPTEPKVLQRSPHSGPTGAVLVGELVLGRKLITWRVSPVQDRTPQRACD
jgi:hypothetical protein